MKSFPFPAFTNIVGVEQIVVIVVAVVVVVIIIVIAEIFIIIGFFSGNELKYFFFVKLKIPYVVRNIANCVDTD